MGLILIFLIAVIVITIVTFLVVGAAMIPPFLFGCVSALMWSLPGGEKMIKTFTALMKFFGNHIILTIVLMFLFVLIAIFFDDVFNVLIRAIWLSALFYAIYPHGIVIALVVLLSIVSLGYNYFTSITSRIIYVGAASPIMFMFAYLILGKVLNRNYDYIVYLDEIAHADLVLVGLAVMFVAFYFFFYKMAKREDPGRLIYKFSLKKLVSVYKPCIIISVICVILLITISCIGSYMNGVFAEHMATIKIICILAVCVFVYLLELFTSIIVMKMIEENPHRI